MHILSTLLRGYTLVLFAYVIASYVPRPPEPLLPAIRLIRAVVDPILTPMRRKIPPLRIGGAGIDMSILILFFVVQLLAGVLFARGL